MLVFLCSEHEDGHVPACLSSTQVGHGSDLSGFRCAIVLCMHRGYARHMILLPLSFDASAAMYKESTSQDTRNQVLCDAYL